VLTRIRSVTIPVADQQRALDFYTRVLGCQLVSDQPMGPEAGAPRWIEVRLPEADTLFVLFAPPGQRDRVGTFTGVVLLCDDILATHRQLAERGVTFTALPERRPWGKWWAEFRDSEGNVFGLGQADEG
jgi:catechol 2,3-dioxygenase-like lactoylglutathione lyase family enzyme